MSLGKELPTVSTTAARERTPLASAATARPFFAGLGFRYFDGTSFYSSAIQFLDRLLSGCVVRHFHETKATAAVGEFVHNNFGRRNFTILGEKFP